MIKKFTRETMYKDILDCVLMETITNALAGNCFNLFTSHMNDFRAASVNYDVAEFIKKNIASLDVDDIASILENPDFIITQAAMCFRETLAESTQAIPNTEFWDDVIARADQIIKSAKTKFDSWGDYYVYANPWSNVCANYYIIRAENESEALSTLLAEFENDFSDEDADDSDDTVSRNDNGVAVNFDNLQLIAHFNFEEIK